jgi:hypothetical protein
MEMTVIAPRNILNALLFALLDNGGISGVGGLRVKMLR